MHSPAAHTLSKWSSSPDSRTPYADHYQLKPALLQTIGTVVRLCLSYRAAQLSESIIYRTVPRARSVGDNGGRGRVCANVGRLRRVGGRTGLATRLDSRLTRFRRSVRVAETVKGALLRVRPHSDRERCVRRRPSRRRTLRRLVRAYRYRARSTDVRKTVGANTQETSAE